MKLRKFNSMKISQPTVGKSLCDNCYITWWHNFANLMRGYHMMSHSYQLFNQRALNSGARLGAVLRPLALEQKATRKLTTAMSLCWSASSSTSSTWDLKSSFPSIVATISADGWLISSINWMSYKVSGPLFTVIKCKHILMLNDEVLQTFSLCLDGHLSRGEEFQVDSVFDLMLLKAGMWQC